jgi:hypothetical protein
MVYFIVALGCWLLTIPLHRFVKQRLRSVGLRPRHFVGPLSAARLYRDYMIEAPGRGWSPWPVYFLRLLIPVMIVEVVSGFATLLWLRSP